MAPLGAEVLVPVVVAGPGHGTKLQVCSVATVSWPVLVQIQEYKSHNVYHEREPLPWQLDRAQPGTGRLPSPTETRIQVAPELHHD
eukprot:1721292-Rhodomonas_salina.1